MLSVNRPMLVVVLNDWVTETKLVLALSKASDLHEMFEATRHLLDFGEFSFANAQVGQAGRADMNERAYHASLQRHPKQVLEFRNGRVFWSWSEKTEDAP